MGLLAGSITLSGGHGTGAAWGSIFTEKYGVQSAAELAIACATFRPGAGRPHRRPGGPLSGEEGAGAR